MVGVIAECPLCEEALGDLPGWDTAPENAIAIHLQRSHPGWEQRLGFLADVLDTLDAIPGDADESSDNDRAGAAESDRSAAWGW